MNEEWKPVTGWGGLYEVSNFGQVRSVPRMATAGFGGNRKTGGNLLKAFASSVGYLAVNFTGPDGRRKQANIHRLVLEAFVGPCRNGLEACHGDGNRMNAALSNLRWDTRKSNHADKAKHGTAQRGEKHGNAIFKDAEVAHIRAERMTVSQVVSLYGCHKGTAKKIISRETWRHV